MNQKKQTVSLEDLLKVKRAERPPAEFWAEFDRELRAKQLAAIVTPRPWWAPFIRVGARLSNYQLPVGAAAILALSLITLRETQTPAPRPATLPDIAMPALAVDATVLTQHRADLAPASAAPSAKQIAELAAPVELAATIAPGASSHAVPLEEEHPEPAEPSPSARYIAANLAAAQADDPGLMKQLFGAMVRRTEVREPVRDPLTQVAAPGETRRSRLLATALPAMATTSDVMLEPNDRAARHLTEERLYDSISRIGVKGDRVAIRF